MRDTQMLKHEEGFTLVELSIVLVIIGLIIGGVLVGQDMIKAAEIRSTVSQIQSYDTAANTFRDKYEYVPGDVAASKVTILGLTTRTGAVGRGD
jgi:prepilin-type N-terminal cleavage/methylation domain-containing protein